MRTVREPADLAELGRPVSVAIGVFDGVHLGHQHILTDLMSRASGLGAAAVVVTFDRHPTEVVAPARTPPRIQTLQQRLAALAALGIEATWLIRFDVGFSRLSGEDFVALLAGRLPRLASIHVGSRFHFGHQRSGHVALLEQLGPRFGYTTHALDALPYEGQPISSTRIRQAIRDGHLDAVRQMLGRAYALAGPVVPGDRRGRTLGFPTANVDTAGLVIPPGGVYAARARWADNRADAVVNIGRRPTIASDHHPLTVEAHLIETQPDLYGRELELELVTRLREERAFPDLDALKAQITRDIAGARIILSAAGT